MFPSEKMNSALEGMFQWGYRCSTIKRSLRLTIVYSSIRHFQVSLKKDKEKPVEEGLALCLMWRWYLFNMIKKLTEIASL